MRLSELGLKQHSKRRAIAWPMGMYRNYGILLASVDFPYLLDVKVDKHLFQALAQFWNPTYSCFTFGKVDLVPTIEEYVALL
ncbi:hypothetical protein Gotur_033173 [Gossypium turneri]